MNSSSRHRALIGLAVILTMFTTAKSTQAEIVRLPTDIIPKFEAIHLNLDPNKSDYTGSVHIEIKVERATKAIQFHAQEMDLQRIILRGKRGTVELKPDTEEDGLVTATAPTTVSPGSYSLDIDFANEFDQRATSLYRLQSGGQAYAFTQFEAVDARLAFPCWDEPSFKFPYQITLSVPEAHEAVSNTPVVSQSVKDGVKTVVFRRTKPLPSYLLAIATGPLEFTPIPGMSIPGRVVSPKGTSALAQAAVAMTPPILAALERYFGRPYPYEKLDLIAVPEYTYGAMENPGAITYADRFLLFDPKTMSVAARRLFATFTAHELAHMWFGNLVTMQWWDDLWLNESFGEWMGDKIASEVFPELQVGGDVAANLQEAMVVDARLSTRAIRQPVHTVSNLLQSADALSYYKGEATISMFEQWIGPQTFRKGILAYLKKHEWGNAEAKDLWGALSKASGRDIGGAMATFIDQPGVPLVAVRVLADGRVQLAQKRFLNFGIAAPPQPLWQVPVTLKYPVGSAVRTHSLLLREDSMTVALPGLSGKPPDWVYPSAGGFGYYRWSVDFPTLLSLADAASESLVPRERIGYLQNLAALLDAGGVRGDDYLRLVASFAEDPRPEVIAVIPDALEGIKRAFINEDLQAPFAVYVRIVLQPSVKRFGLDRARGEEDAVSIIRPPLIEWLADDGRDEEVLAHADGLATSFLADRGSIDPSLVAVALGVSAIRGDGALFEVYKKRFEDSEIPTDRMPLLGALGNFRDPKLREAALAYNLEGPLRPQEHFTIPQSMSRTVAYQGQVFDWVTRNYDELSRRMPPIYAIFLPHIGTGCLEANLLKAKAFYSVPEHSAPGSEVELARVLEGGRDCVGLRDREGEAVARYLTQIVGGE